MAKKKQIVISQEELVPTTLAVVEDKKKASVFGIIWIFIIFVIFIAGVIYLPEISSYVSNYVNPEETDTYTPSNKAKKEEDTTEKEKAKEYTISNELVITEEKFTVSSFVLEENVIKFKIKNLTEDVIDLNDLHYYMQLYNDNKKLLQRIYLQDIVSPNSEVDASYILLDNAPTTVSLVVISESDYPNYIVNANQDGTATLTCQKDYEKIEYILNNNKVYVTNIIYEVQTTDVNFNILYSNYQVMQTTYNNIEGVSSNISLDNNILNFKTIINLSALKENTLNLKTVYAYGTDAKVIYFEMSSSGYTCS